MGHENGGWMNDDQRNATKAAASPYAHGRGSWSRLLEVLCIGQSVSGVSSGDWDFCLNSAAVADMTDARYGEFMTMLEAAKLAVEDTRRHAKEARSGGA